MINKSGLIECPHCKEKFKVDEVIEKHLHKINEKEEKLKRKELAIENERQSFTNKLQEAKEEIVNKEKEEREKIIEEKIKEANSKKDLEFKNKEYELRGQIEKKIKAQVHKEAKEQNKRLIDEAYKKGHSEINEKHLKETKSYQLQLKRRDDQIEKLSRQSKQGAVELQGEAQEEIIEDFLNKYFPNDIITPIKKGARGADCIQEINEGKSINLGRIIYESKDTQEFSEKWVQKLLDDMTKKNIGYGVIVTETMPKNSSNPIEYRHDGRIIICPMNFNFLFIVAVKLRQLVTRINNLKNLKTSAPKAMQELWKMITNDRFALQLKQISEGFLQELSLLDKDQKSAVLSHKNRKKLIEDRQALYIDMISNLSTIEGALPNNFLENNTNFIE